MTELTGAHIVLALWGFLVGFVGWGSCFRLVEPLADWLVSTRSPKPLVTATCRILVAVFLILACLALVSLFALVGDRSGLNGDQSLTWRDRFGISFLSSMVGLFSLGALRRFASSDAVE